jgi:hypothetical protein
MRAVSVAGLGVVIASLGTVAKRKYGWTYGWLRMARARHTSGMTHHVIHRLVKDHIAQGSHDIDVVRAQEKPRRYQAICHDCAWKSNVGTATVADNALMKHRDDMVAAAKARRGNR